MPDFDETRVGDIIENLKRAGRQHAIVIEPTFGGWSSAESYPSLASGGGRAFRLTPAASPGHSPRWIMVQIL
ncbi:MAG TPA: hypothetical protein VNF46_00855 [Gammaproteobacteria bacterium]|nr:hypothetical protein [Gammaproteobacteria bacterium]